MGLLVPPPGIKPALEACKCRILTTGLPEKSKFYFNCLNQLKRTGLKLGEKHCLQSKNMSINKEIIKYMYPYWNNRASQVAVVVKNPPANAGDIKRSGFNPV